MTLYDAIFPLSWDEILLFILWAVGFFISAVIAIRLEKKKEKDNERYGC